MPHDELVRTITSDGSVALRSVVATGLVTVGTARRPLSLTATSALGRALMGAVLLAVSKGDADEDGPSESVQLQFRGDGPLGTVMAISDSLGRVRGTVANPAAEPPLREGRLDVRGGIGRGVLTVVRHRPGWREPYRGSVPIETGEIARDLTRYLTVSEQTPSALGLGVALDAEGAITGAGGFLVQALPDADEETLERMERNVEDLPSVSRLVRDGARADELLDLLLRGTEGGVRVRSMPTFYCPCSRERALHTVSLLPASEIGGIIEAGGSQEVCCEFCGEAYLLSTEELASLV